MPKTAGGWIDLGGADEHKPAKDGSVEAWGRSPGNPVGGWYGRKKGLRGRVYGRPSWKSSACASSSPTEEQSNACKIDLGGRAAGLAEPPDCGLRSAPSPSRGTPPPAPPPRGRPGSPRGQGGARCLRRRPAHRGS